MKDLSLKTLVSSLNVENDYELKKYAKDCLERRYGEEITGILSSALRAQEECYIDFFQCLCEKLKGLSVNGIPAEEVSELIKQLSDTRERKTHVMPIGCIMEMYRSGDEFLVSKSKEHIVNNYGNYVLDIIHSYYNTYAATCCEDMYQCGVIGLIKALKSYDETLGRFTTYCKPFVQHEIAAQINFQNNDTTVHYNNVQKKIAGAVKYLEAEGIEPTVHKVEILTELSANVIKRELEYIENTRFKYLDDTENNDGYEPSTYSASPERLFEEKERNEHIKDSIQSLPPQIREVIIHKFILNETNENISKELDLTLGRVKSYREKGLHMMRHNPHFCKAFPEYLTAAERKMLNYSISQAPSHKNTEEEIDELMDLMSSF